jgi:integral membrane protein
MKWLQRAAILEGLTLIALVCIAMPLKYWAGLPGLVSIIGPIHGAAFIGFAIMILYGLSTQLIGIWGGLRLFIGALIPFGGFVNERWLGSLCEQPSK